MTRGQRRRHLVTWILLGPAALAVIVLGALAARPAVPDAAPPVPVELVP